MKSKFFCMIFSWCFQFALFADVNRDCDQLDGFLRVESQLKGSEGLMDHNDLVLFFKNQSTKQYGYDFVHERLGPILLTGAKIASDGRNILSYHFEIGTRNIFFSEGYRIAPKDSPAGQLLMKRWELLRN